MRSIDIKPVYRNSIAGGIAIIGILMLFLFSTHTIAPVWKGYRVLAVPLSLSENDIVQMLEHHKLSGIVSESNSMIASTNAMSPIRLDERAENAVRLKWFRNPRDNLRYFFLPETPLIESKIANAFDDSDFSWFFERASKNMVSVILVSLFVACSLCISKNRIFLSAAGLSLILYAYSCNHLVGYLSAIFTFGGCVFLANLIEPDNQALSGKQRIVRIRQRRSVLLAILIPVAVAGFGGIGNILPYGISVILAVSLRFLFSSTTNTVRYSFERKRLHPAFRPKIMHPVAMTKKWPGKMGTVLAVTMCLLAVAGFFIFLHGQSQMRNEQELYIPAPTGYTQHNGFDIKGFEELIGLRNESEIPDLGSFICFRWNMETAPWRRLQEPSRDPDPGETIGTTVYSADENGVITGTTRIMYTFDTNFIREILSSDTSPLERMLIRQGRFVTVGLSRHMR